MGYRSDVGFACAPIVKDMIITLADWDKEFSEGLQSADDLSSDDNGRWFFSGTKWYDTFSDVEMFENIMTMLDELGLKNSEERPLDDSYGFLRIGEESDDVEYRGSPGDYDIYLNRSLDI